MPYMYLLQSLQGKFLGAHFQGLVHVLILPEQYAISLVVDLRYSQYHGIINIHVIKMAWGMYLNCLLKNELVKSFLCLVFNLGCCSYLGSEFIVPFFTEILYMIIEFLFILTFIVNSLF